MAGPAWLQAPEAGAQGAAAGRGRCCETQAEASGSAKQLPHRSGLSVFRLLLSGSWRLKGFLSLKKPWFLAVSALYLLGDLGQHRNES